VPLPESLRALRSPNFRRYYVGQAVSMLGTWMLASMALPYLAWRTAPDTNGGRD